MNWNTRRQIIYAVAVSVLAIASFLYIFRDTFFPTPTCFDKKQNGYESGIDCGGTCSLRCNDQVTPLSVKWSKSILSAPSTYDLVALVSNKNIDNASRALGYSFLIYNEKGSIIANVTGTTTAPVDGDFPIIKQSVRLPEAPKEVVLQLNDTSHFIVSEKPTSPTLITANTYFENGSIPRVYSTIINTKRVTISNLPVRAVLYDTNNNVFAVGETIIPFLDKEESKNISFTWDFPLTQAPVVINIYPIFDPFSAVQ